MRKKSLLFIFFVVCVFVGIVWHFLPRPTGKELVFQRAVHQAVALYYPHAHQSVWWMSATKDPSWRDATGRDPTLANVQFYLVTFYLTGSFDAQQISVEYYPRGIYVQGNRPEDFSSGIWWPTQIRRGFDPSKDALPHMVPYVGVSDQKRVGDAYRISSERRSPPIQASQRNSESTP